MPEITPTPRRTRRELLITGTTALAAGTIGWAAVSETAHALTGHNTLDSSDCKLYYEPTGNPVTLQFNDTFYNQLSTWKRWTSYNVPDSWGSPVEVYSYGAYVNKPGMHGEGLSLRSGALPLQELRRHHQAHVLPL